MRRPGSPTHPWVLLVAALTLTTLRCGAGAQEAAATEGKSQPTDATDTNDGGWEGHLWLRTLDEETEQSADTLPRSFLSRSSPDPEPGWNGTEEASEASVITATGNAAFGTEASQSETPIDMSSFANNPDVDPTSVAISTAKSFSLEGSTLGYDPSGTLKDSGGPMDGGLEALGAVTSIAWSPDKEVFALPVTNTRKVARDAEDPEEAGSGDVYAILPESVLSHPHPGAKEQDQTAAIELPTPPPSQSANTEVKGLETRQVDQGISPDSAETDLLLGVHRDDVLPPPTPDSKSSSEAFEIQPEAEDRFDFDRDEDPSSLWEESTRKSVLQGAQRSTDLTALDKKGQVVPWMVTTSPPKTLKSTEPPSDPPARDIIDIDYYDLFDIDGQGGPEDFPRSPSPGEDSTKKLHDKKPAWPLSELYDDFTPFDESDFYPTTSFYADGDEDGANQDEDDEDEIEVDDREEDEVTGRDLEDENSAKPLTFTPKLPTVAREEKPTSRQHVPHHTFILSGGDVNTKYQPDTNKDLTQMMAGDNGTECRTGYVRFNNSCKSVCDMYPMYCYNSGQCYLVENIGAFCRCNTQDYIWHKGLRCESIITDFQVMCVAVGAAALVVLLLFMMTVFFAKKLYLLKTENYKLRKRNRYRTPSELHNDNFSLSTIAEGSHPNVRKLCDTPCKLSPHARALAYYDNVICQEDPSAPLKLQEPPRSAPKEEEAFNIQNSLSLKAEGEKCQQDSPEVNCLQNNLT